MWYNDTHLRMIHNQIWRISNSTKCHHNLLNFRAYNLGNSHSTWVRIINADSSLQLLLSTYIIEMGFYLLLQLKLHTVWRVMMSFAVPLIFYFIFIIVRKAIFVRSTLIISNVGFGSGYQIYFPRYETIFIRTKNRN